MITRLLSAFACLASTVTVVAQTSPTVPSPAGNYVVVNRNGGPPIPGSTTTTVIAPTAVPGVLVGVVFADDGSGPHALPGESMVIVGSGGVYAWQNERCTEGRFLWMGGGEWLSEVLTGTNKGVLRRLLPTQ